MMTPLLSIPGDRHVRMCDEPGRHRQDKSPNSISDNASLSRTIGTGPAGRLQRQGREGGKEKKGCGLMALCREHGLQARRVRKGMGVEEGSGVIGEIYIGRVSFLLLAWFALGLGFFLGVVGCVPCVNARVWLIIVYVLRV
jgi:hypothetical protein